MPTATQNVRSPGWTGSGWPTVRTALMTQCMVRPCVARDLVDLASAVLHQCIRSLIGACCAPDHHGYQRACVLISGQASTGHLGQQCSHAPGRPILHLFFSSRRPPRVIGAGLRHRLSFQYHRLSGGRLTKFGRFEVSPVRKNAPGDPGQFIG
jgi:hypothetical protein